MLDRFAVDVEFHARRLTGTVVRSKDMRPFSGFEVAFGDHFDCVVRPFIYQMHRHPAFVVEQVPAAIGVRLVHARHDCPDRIRVRGFDPCAIRERLVFFKVANVPQFDCDVLGGLKGFFRNVSRAPNQIGLVLERARFAVRLIFERVAFTLCEAGVE